MNSIKYVGLDVHQSTISVAVLDSDGKLVMQSILATQARAILDFFAGLRGTLHVTFEEGSQAAWLYDLLVERVAKLVVCNPGGFYRRGCQEKIVHPRRQRGVVLWHPAPVDAGMSFAAAGSSGFRFHVTASSSAEAAQATWVVMANHGSIGDSPAGGRRYGFVGLSEGAYGGP